MSSTPTSDNIFKSAVSVILAEIFDGPPGDSGYLLNPGDVGLLKELETISAKQASTRPMPGRTTIAAHVDHIHYGLELLNRWALGEENPWATADWKQSWTRGIVDEKQWQTLRDKLSHETRAWQTNFQSRTDWDPITAAGAISSAAHTAYHMGAIRQIIAATI